MTLIKRLAKTLFVEIIWKQKIWILWVLTGSILSNFLFHVHGLEWKYWAFIIPMIVLTFWYGNERVDNYKTQQEVLRRLVGKDSGNG